MAVPALIEPGNSSNLMATVRAWKRMVAAGFTLSVRDDRLIVAPADRLTDSNETALVQYNFRDNCLNIINYLGLFTVLVEPAGPGLATKLTD